jgi:hypothetical protein
VNIVTAIECFEHIMVATQMRHNTKFDLRIVGAEKHTTFVGDKGFANFLALGIAYRDVLQIRIG